MVVEGLQMGNNTYLRVAGQVSFFMTKWCLVKETVQEIEQQSVIRHSGAQIIYIS